MISSKFPKSFRGDLEVFGGDLEVFYWSINFLKIFWGFSDFKKITKHHQVTSTRKTVRKLVWNRLMEYWLNFDKNRSFLFCAVKVLNISRLERVLFRHQNKVLFKHITVSQIKLTQQIWQTGRAKVFAYRCTFSIFANWALLWSYILL